MSAEVWSAILAAIPDVERWNFNLPRLVKENGEEFKRFAQAEAARRSYLWAPDSKCYICPWSMHPCESKNAAGMLGAGAREGVLAVIFAGKDGPVRYESEPQDREWAHETAGKLIRGLYPRRLYQQIVLNKGIKMVRVD